jgi:hypothetical protein
MVHEVPFSGCVVPADRSHIHSFSKDSYTYPAMHPTLVIPIELTRRKDSAPKHKLTPTPIRLLVLWLFAVALLVYKVLILFKGSG